MLANLPGRTRGWPRRSSRRRVDRVAAWRATSTARWAGCVRSLLHRPGAELKRLTPRNNDQLLFDGIPWVDRAQEEHDGFAQALRDHGVEVLYLGELLEQALADQDARESTVAAVLDDPRLGPTLRAVVAPAPARPAPGRPGRGAHGRAHPARS